MDRLVVVTYPKKLDLEARPLDHAAIPDGAVGLGYYHEDLLIARGIVPTEAVGPIEHLLDSPVSLALAATEDDDGNIEGRVCLVLPVDSDRIRSLQQPDPDDADREPWQASLPDPPDLSDGFDGGSSDDGDGEKPQLALLPIGNVVRHAQDRHHPDDVSRDAREMLVNLLSGKARDAVQKAIDDLLNSI